MINPTIEKADEQRQAASAAIELLTDRLGPDLARFADLYEAASFRFRPALLRGITAAGSNDDRDQGRP